MKRWQPNGFVCRRKWRNAQITNNETVPKTHTLGYCLICNRTSVEQWLVIYRWNDTETGDERTVNFVPMEMEWALKQEDFSLIIFDEYAKSH